MHHDNIANRTWEDSRRHPKSRGARGRQVGPPDPTLAPAGAPYKGFGPPFGSFLQRLRGVILAFG